MRGVEALLHHFPRTISTAPIDQPYLSCCRTYAEDSYEAIIGTRLFCKACVLYYIYIVIFTKSIYFCTTGGVKAMH
jgi:hypothetical protein